MSDLRLKSKTGLACWISVAMSSGCLPATATPAFLAVLGRILWAGLLKAHLEDSKGCKKLEGHFCCGYAAPGGPMPINIAAIRILSIVNRNLSIVNQSWRQKPILTLVARTTPQR